MSLNTVQSQSVIDITDPLYIDWQGRNILMTYFLTKNKPFNLAEIAQMLTFIDINHVNNDGRTVLDYAVLCLAPYEVYELLLEAGADTNKILQTCPFEFQSDINGKPTTDDRIVKLFLRFGFKTSRLTR